MLHCSTCLAYSVDQHPNQRVLLFLDLVSCSVGPCNLSWEVKYSCEFICLMVNCRLQPLQSKLIGNAKVSVSFYVSLRPMKLKIKMRDAH